MSEGIQELRGRLLEWNRKIDELLMRVQWQGMDRLQGRGPLIASLLHKHDQALIKLQLASRRPDDDWAMDEALAAERHLTDAWRTLHRRRLAEAHRKERPLERALS